MGVYDRDWWKEAHKKKTGAHGTAPNEQSTWTKPSNNGWHSAQKKHKDTHPLVMLLAFLFSGTFIFAMFTLIGDKVREKKVQIVERVITPATPVAAMAPVEKMPPPPAPAPQALPRSIAAPPAPTPEPLHGYRLSPAEQTLLRQADERIARVRREGQIQQQNDINAARNSGRCAQLEVDQRMLEDQIRRTGWDLEQQQTNARLQETLNKMHSLGCR